MSSSIVNTYPPAAALDHELNVVPSSVWWHAVGGLYECPAYVETRQIGSEIPIGEIGDECKDSLM